MAKKALFAFRGDDMCIVHVWLNALDLKEKGHDVKIVIEGSATELIKKYHDLKEKQPFYNLYVKCKELGLIDGTCKACASKMKSIKEAEAEGLEILGDMTGHPSMSRYMDMGFEIITF